MRKNSMSWHYTISLAGIAMSGLGVFLPGKVHAADTVFPNPVEVQGGTCIGSTACVSGEDFTSADLKVKVGDSPTLRLEQTTTGGFAAQNWDVAGNDADFAIADATHNTIPFIIKPNAPDNSLFIAANGKVGLGTLNPQGNLHIAGGTNQDIFNGIGPDLSINGTALNFGYSGGSFGVGSGFFNVRPAAGSSAPNPSLRFATANIQRMIITNAGLVGINTTTPTQVLDVNGNIRAAGSFIAGSTTLIVPDYVFASDYPLMPLAHLEKYIAHEQHLPDIPSAQEIKEQGVNLSTLQMQLLKKVEELTLYTLQQEKTIHQQAQTIAAQNATIQEFKGTLTGLTSALAALQARMATLERAHETAP